MSQTTSKFANAAANPSPTKENRPLQLQVSHKTTSSPRSNSIPVLQCSYLNLQPENGSYSHPADEVKPDAVQSPAQEELKAGINAMLQAGGYPAISMRLARENVFLLPSITMKQEYAVDLGELSIVVGTILHEMSERGKRVKVRSREDEG